MEGIQNLYGFPTGDQSKTTGLLGAKKVKEVGTKGFFCLQKRKWSTILNKGELLWSLRRKENQVGKRFESSVFHKSGDKREPSSKANLSQQLLRKSKKKKNERANR